jgi:hypothetical protein
LQGLAELSSDGACMADSLILKTMTLDVWPAHRCQIVTPPQPQAVCKSPKHTRGPPADASWKWALQEWAQPQGQPALWHGTSVSTPEQAQAKGTISAGSCARFQADVNMAAGRQGKVQAIAQAKGTGQGRDGDRRVYSKRCVLDPCRGLTGQTCANEVRGHAHVRGVWWGER